MSAGRIVSKSEVVGYDYGSVAYADLTEKRHVKKSYCKRSDVEYCRKVFIVGE